MIVFSNVHQKDSAILQAESLKILYPSSAGSVTAVIEKQWTE